MKMKNEHFWKAVLNSLNHCYNACHIHYLIKKFKRLILIVNKFKEIKIFIRIAKCYQNYLHT